MPTYECLTVGTRPTADQKHDRYDFSASEEKINDFVSSNFSPNLNLKIKIVNFYLPKLQNGKYDLMKMLKQSSTQ